MKSGIGPKLIKWHHSIAQVTGGMSIAIGKRKISRHDMQSWIKILDKVADEMRYEEEKDVK